MTYSPEKHFEAELHIIGINPYVFVPVDILNWLFEKAGKSKGQIPVKGMVNDVPFTQTLLRYQGDWRLYINTSMLKNSPKRVGEILRISIEFDSADRSISPHPDFLKALEQNPLAKERYARIPPSLQKEINRQIQRIKSEEVRERNIQQAIDFLCGKGRFIGRPPLEQK